MAVNVRDLEGCYRIKTSPRDINQRNATGVRDRNKEGAILTYIRVNALLIQLWPFGHFSQNMLIIHGPLPRCITKSLCDHKTGIWQLSNSIHLRPGAACNPALLKLKFGTKNGLLTLAPVDKKKKK